MNPRLAAGALAVVLATASCTGITGEAKPGDSMAKLCQAAQALGGAVGLSRASAAASASGDGLAAADFARQADTLRQEGMAATGYAADLEGHLASTVGFADRMKEIDAAQKAVDLAVGVLGSPAASVTLEARPRLLDAAEDAVHAIGLPLACTVIEVPTPRP